ncbi:hypothetical protein D3C87_1328380 [compost metagenome]
MIEIAAVQIHHTGSGGRWWFESDQVIALWIAQQFLATVTQSHVDAGIGGGIEVALEQRRCLDHRGQQFGDDAMFKARVLRQRAGGDTGAEADHQRRARFSVVDQQRQQRLNAHVAQGWHGVTGVGYALDIQALECFLPLALGDHGHGSAASFFIERQRAVACAGQQAGQFVDRGKDGQRYGQQADGDHCLTPTFLDPMPLAHCKVTDPGGNDRQQAQGTNQSQQRDQHEPAEHHPDNPAEGIECDNFTDIAPHMVTADAQAQGHGKGRAEQQGRYKNNAQRRHRKACAHAQQFTGAERQHPRFDHALGNYQPASQQGDFQQRNQPGTGNQQTEYAPGIAQAIDPAG